MKTNGTHTNTTGKSYPFSSKREALRASRRRQGGPGITEGSNPESRNQGHVQTVEHLEIREVSLINGPDPVGIGGYVSTE